MARERKCILCETVHASKQDMDEHVRSMLHHRELEKLKGRDCGHECRVCKVTVTSLTDYASHISSPSHKQNVETADRKHTGMEWEKDYFDPQLVDLIEKRKEQIRKEKEAAAAKLAKEEEERRKREEFKQRLKETKGFYQSHWAQPQGIRAGHHKSWNRAYQYGDREQQPWMNHKQGKSATWHAQAPPNYDTFSSEGHGGYSWGHKQWNQGNSYGGGRGRLPWLSNGGSNHGLYGRNNVMLYPENNSKPCNLFSPSAYPPPKHLFASDKQAQKPDNQQKSHAQTASPNTESDHSSVKNSKKSGSNPKLDKACRWSPYPDPKDHKDAKSHSAERRPKAHETQKQDPPSEAEPSKKQWATGSGQSEEDKWARKKKQNKDKGDDRSSRSTAPKDGLHLATSIQKTKKQFVPDDGKWTSTPKDKHNPIPAKPSSQKKAPLLETMQLELDLEPALVAKPRTTESLDNSKSNRLEVSEKEQSKDRTSSQTGLNKEIQCGQSAPKTYEATKGTDRESSQCFESPLVGTVTMPTSKPAGPSKAEQALVDASGEVVQTEDAKMGSESDASRSDEAVSSAQGSSKKELLPTLKRDLTKHMSSKSKTGPHEPNLNIARRVRDIGELRRSDSDKDSGLKPTVRQLISSSGSRRNVNWDQVYQELRKKQDKGKGMPRFGIEMVACDQDDQSQEDVDISVLEGFHWDSIMDVHTPTVSRSRSLSESSVAPNTAHSFFPANKSAKAQRGGVSAEVRGATSYSKMFGGDETQGVEPRIDKEMSASAKQADLILADSSSGEQLDSLGTGKRRRAAGDGHNPEAAGLEHDSKRRKTKSKKERSHIDQLLVVSLREEELSRSMQTVETNLIQARAALEAAYRDVQQFMVMKQQITEEMSTLRTKRIELLKGMQGGLDEAPEVRVKEEKMFAETLAPSTGGDPCPDLPGAAARQVTTSSLPAVVKQEPRSPVHVSSAPDVVENLADLAHSTTSELHVPGATASPPGPSFDKQPDPECPRDQGALEEREDSKEDLAGLKSQRARSASLPDSNLPVQRSTDSRRGSEMGSLEEFFRPTSVPSVVSTPASPSEVRSGKRVRKLKKRKVLKKAQGAEQMESSDTEMDGEIPRARWLRPRRKPGTTQGSPVREGGVSLERGKSSDSSKQRTNLDSEESMEVTAACGASGPTLTSESFKPEPQSLACNEVTSTSDMELCKSSEGDLTLPKTDPALFSDHGEDEDPKEGAFQGHQETVNGMLVHNGSLYTCSGDRTVKAFDLVSHKCVAVFEGHSSKVNCLLVSAAPCLHHRLFTGSSDQTIRCYSLRSHEYEQQFALSDRVLCLHARWRTLYAGLANGTVVTFNLKTNKQMDVFECHGPRAVSCLASSQEGARRILLVSSYDNTISVRDAKNGLLLRTLQGHTKTVLCMTVVNDLVFSGSMDHCVHAHNIHTGELVRVYKGHTHAVTVVVILGKVMVTACLDKLVHVYDLESGKQLVVYGGHKDMVTCMTVHKDMIYTGCYDGSMKAVKLNLDSTHRCWWSGCTLVFSLMEDLQQHLVHDHASANFQILKCRWKNCEELLNARTSSKQAILMHMKKHAQETELEL
ncbi:zinc finger protein 106 [Neosynchiropus ocellatus]